jgi:serine/threonine-protein kinase SRPK3
MLHILTSLFICVSVPLCTQATALASFLTPMLEFVPEQRATAAEMLSHPWLQVNPEEEAAYLKQVRRREEKAGGT